MVVLDVFSSFDGVTYKVHFRVLQYLQWLFSSGHVDFMTCFMVQWFIHDSCMIHHDSLLHVSCFIICIFQAKNDPFLASCHLTISPIFSPKPLSHRRWNAKTVGKHATLPPWDCDKNEGKGCKLVNGWTPRIFQIFQVLPAWRDHHFGAHKVQNGFKYVFWWQFFLPQIMVPVKKSDPNQTRRVTLWRKTRQIRCFSTGPWLWRGFGPKIRVLLWVWRQTVSISPRKKLKWTWEILNIAFHSSTKKHGFADPSEIVIWQQRPRKMAALKTRLLFMWRPHRSQYQEEQKAQITFRQ